jgi:hypothetical protein
MQFDLDRTTHVFRKTADGGVSADPRLQNALHRWFDAQTFGSRFRRNG